MFVKLMGHIQANYHSKAGPGSQNLMSPKTKAFNFKSREVVEEVSIEKIMYNYEKEIQQHKKFILEFKEKAQEQEQELETLQTKYEGLVATNEAMGRQLAEKDAHIASLEENILNNQNLLNIIVQMFHGKRGRGRGGPEDKHRQMNQSTNFNNFIDSMKHFDYNFNKREDRHATSGQPPIGKPQNLSQQSIAHVNRIAQQAPFEQNNTNGPRQKKSRPGRQKKNMRQPIHAQQHKFNTMKPFLYKLRSSVNNLKLQGVEQPRFKQ